ncbi:MAG TPA: SBBP repeat-containing protein [Bryobacteraceae bacterium]
MFRSIFLAGLLASLCPGANLAVSTYFRDGFTPSAMTSDASGNLYIVGTVPLDPESPGATAAVAKLDPMATRYRYLAYLDAAASDSISAIAVDSAGNAYVAGQTTNPNFPSVGSGQLGTPPTSAQDPRSFVVKLDPGGAVVFSVLVGGSVPSDAVGIALTPRGQILVSGIALATGFPATAGAYSVADSADNWFLMEVDPTASQMIFSATGIGGSSIALDAAGNIYLAGSSGGTNYPTTPGAYQTTFVQGHICFGLCQIGFDGVLQHVTKVDPAATKLIYSTGINDLTGGAGSTSNTGLAVDAAGNAYVTGTLLEALYPFTVATPQNTYGFLTKLDAGGDSLLFSIPVGGAGVQIDSTGAVYVGGVVSSYDPTGLGVPVTPIAPPPVFSWIPQACWPNNIVAISEAYVMKIDPNSGNVEDAQWVDGSAPIATALTLASGNAWIVGTTPAPDVPFTPGVLSPRNIGPGFTAGAFLAAADFSSSPGTGPAIACVLDSGNFTHVGAVAAFQLISVFGENLGPATGVVANGSVAPDGSDPTLAGVNITFDGNPAQLLYVSATQINVAVPAPPASINVSPLPTKTVMEIAVNGQTVERQFPLTSSNLNVFAQLNSNQISCPHQTANGFQPTALNAGGSMNACSNPAKFGSTVSFFVEGVGATQLGFPPTQTLTGIEAAIGNCTVPAANASLITGFVYQVDIPLPDALLPCATSYSLTSPENSFQVTLSSGTVPMGPRVIPSPGGAIINFAPGQPMPMVIWVTE